MPVCTRCNAAILSVGNYSQQNSLSTRQAEVLALLCEGLANKEIARALGISACTVKLHVQGVLQKLGAANRVQADGTCWDGGAFWCIEAKESA